MHTIEPEQRKAAKAAGIFYLLAFAAVVYANFAIFERMSVAGNPTATAQNILAHPMMFRIGIMCDVFYCTAMLAVVAALYVVVEPMSRGLALLSTIWKLVFVLAWVTKTLKALDVLRLLNTEYLRVFSVSQVQALAKLTFGTSFDLYYDGLWFYALGGTLSFYLLFKSGYIPKSLAAIGMASLAWCAFCTGAFLLSPNFQTIVGLWWFDTPMGLSEIALSIWFIAKGLGTSRAAIPSIEAHAIA